MSRLASLTSLGIIGTLKKTRLPVSTIFTGSGTFTVPPAVRGIDILLIAGGGGAAGAEYGGGGGGGAGGVRLFTSYPVAPGSVFNIIVGGGGAGNDWNNYFWTGQNGSNSGIYTPLASWPGSPTSPLSSPAIWTTGGGGGNSKGASPGVGVPGRGGGSGGGGGGGGNSTVWSGGLGNLGDYATPEGNNGGGGGFSGGGGGGGAGSVGETKSYGGGNGGIGIFSTLSGTNTAYAGGGGAVAPWFTPGPNQAVRGTGGGGSVVTYGIATLDNYGAPSSLVAPYGAFVGTPFGGGAARTYYQFEQSAGENGVAFTGGGGGSSDDGGGNGQGRGGAGGSGIVIIRY